MWEIAQPEEFDRLADPTDRQALERGVLISADDDETAEKLAALAAVGADELYLHEVSTDQSAFLTRAGGGLLDLVRRLT
jgi:coenzyme F420-dependent glucose-6-phosphate dehydrogenase